MSLRRFLLDGDPPRLWWGTVIASGLAGLLLTTCSPPAESAELGMHVGSWHSAPGFSNSNPGLYLRTEEWAGGLYRNSYHRTSFYAARVSTWPIGPVDAELSYGLISGYQRPFLLAPSLATAVGPYRLRLVYLPKVEKGGAHVLHLMAGRAF